MTPAVVMASRWCCRRCLGPVSGGGNSLERSVHAGTGSERCADGRLIAPVDEDPALRGEANEIERDYPAFTVSARFGFFRGDWREADPGAVRGHFDADTGTELRQQLAAATRRRPS